MDWSCGRCSLGTEALLSNLMTTGMQVRIGVRLLLLQARWDPARMQGLGFAFAIDPWLVACWADDPEGLLVARRRHLEYFNTHPIAAWLAAGIVCRQEACAAALTGAAREAEIIKIKALKARLGAALAGPYDSFFWGALRPASALAGILAAQIASCLGVSHAPIWAVAVALATYNVPAVMARILGLRRGLSDGEQATAVLITFPAQTWIRALRRATVVGSVCVFALSVGQFGGGSLRDSCAFMAGLVLSWRDVAPLTQLVFFGVGGMAVAAAGLWP